MIALSHFLIIIKIDYISVNFILNRLLYETFNKT